MSAALPPRASANAPRPIAACSPGLRRFGNPATLPFRWMPNRMRADVLTLRDFVLRRPLAGLGYTLAIVGGIGMTLLLLAGPSVTINADHASLTMHTPEHAQHTIR